MKDIDLMVLGKLRSSKDNEIISLSMKSQLLIERYNITSVRDIDTRTEILKELLGKIDGKCTIKPPFHCDYGKFIEIGDGTFINYDCIILDACKVKIGKNVMIGPRTCIFTSSHPIYAPVRISGYNISKPINIGDDVWIGGCVVLNPGVSIGKGSVIGSGSVVTKDIPENVIAFGNPCCVIRNINDKDKEYWENLREEYLQNNGVEI
ncbi:sugar O-acetyltransferase [uncultured Ruminococcus sp.]|jgi:maltose O-acetyltransferase|uniref:sugar O-acetyltransferase n=1 Tax=uncultured Ruminococcus sp. TaxID=165186 RepID=UPI0026668FFE|nr:sugar O-acetyltransferase [uncultured Ruminococcus sp.]